MTPWLLFLLGCTRDVDMEMPSCDETATALAVDEVGPLGFSAADVLAPIAGLQAPLLSWNTGGTTTLEIEVPAQPDVVRHVDSEPAPATGTGASLAIAPVCEDRMEIDLAIRHTTADGELDEVLDATLVAVEADAATYDVRLEPEDIQGTFDPEEHVELPAGWVDVWSWVHGAFQLGSASGQLTVAVEGVSDCGGDECATWLEETQVAIWPGVAER